MGLLSEEDRRILQEIAEVFADPITGERPKVVCVRRHVVEPELPQGGQKEIVMGFERVGKLWKGREGGKSVATGTLKIDGREIRVGIFKNTKREGEAGAKDADFEVLILPEHEGGGR